MKKILFFFLLGAVAGALGFWFFSQTRSRQSLAEARDSITSGAGKLKEAIQEKASEIPTEELKRELERSGMVVREKAGQAGAAIADATANARITAAVKGKLLTELGVAALSINVDTTDGLVTLSGTASSHEEIAKAVRLALDTEGVRKVISTMQIKSAK